MFFSSFFSKLLRITHLNSLPFQCLLCCQRTHDAKNICKNCVVNLPILSHHCLRCAQNLSIEQANLICGFCLKNPPPMHRTYALFSYEPPITHLITSLKFGHKLSYGQALGELLAEKVLYEWYKNTPLPQQIIPVPLHSTRLKERGFNQSIEIALPLSTRIPIDKYGIIRTKPTVAQSQLSARDRIKNMANAFILKRNYQGKHVAILDDVMTTGATIRELSRTLLKGGAGQIDVWCCARRSDYSHI